MSWVLYEYRVCNRLLNPETNEHCEFDGKVSVFTDATWFCPSCGARRASA